MPRTTPALVGTIIDVATGDGLDAFIFTANDLVTDQCSKSGYTVDRLELIERWLSAHFYDVNRSRAQMQTVPPGVTQQNEPIRVDLGLNVTKYGQMAMLIDTAGNLAALNNSLLVVKKPLGVGGVTTQWLGTPRKEWPNATP